MRPLSDLRVLDLTVARAGPMCVRQLADWGADVVRVEPPAAGKGLNTQRHGSDFQNLHRNKRSLGLDLKSVDGRAILLRLAASADVLVENMRPVVKDRLGIGYEDVRAVNPRLVYGSISGFGQDGPYGDRGGLDQIAQGLGGLMSVTGEPGRGPMRVGIPVADLAAGLYLAVGILVALHEREQTGVGRWVRTSLLEAMVGMLDFQAARWTMDGEVPVQEGNHHPTMVPMGCFAASDGFINIAAPQGRLLTDFCRATGLEHLLDDPRFSSSAKRSANRAELNAIVQERLRSESVEHWLGVLTAAGVPVGPVNTIDQTFADPQIEHLGMRVDVDHPLLGPIGLVRSPVTMARAGEQRAPERAAPEAGADTVALLQELGFTCDQIDDLRRRGVVRDLADAG